MEPRIVSDTDTGDIVTLTADHSGVKGYCLIKLLSPSGEQVIWDSYDTANEARHAATDGYRRNQPLRWSWLPHSSGIAGWAVRACSCSILAQPHGQ